MYLLLAVSYRLIAWHIPPLIPFCTVENLRISLKRSNFTLILFKVACHANRGAVRKQAGSNSYILRHLFRKFSNTSANNNVLV